MDDQGLLWGRLIVPDIDWIWAFVGVFFLIYLALNTVFDRPVGGSADVMVNRPLSAFMVGLLVLLLAGPVLAIIAASVIGLVVVPFIICAVVVAGLVGKAGVARAIGRSVLRSETPDARSPGHRRVHHRLRPADARLHGAAARVPHLGVDHRARTRRRDDDVPVASAPGTAGAAAGDSMPPLAPATVPSGAAAAVAVGPSGDFASASPTCRPRRRSHCETAPQSTVYTQGLAKYPRASFLDRLAAFALDCILVAIANAILDMDRHDGFFFFLLLAYHVAFWAWRGTTLGGIICNLRVIGPHGAELRPSDAVVRGLSSMFSVAALGIGCLWMLQDPERQMWHDKIAGTLVVKVPRDLVLPQ